MKTRTPSPLRGQGGIPIGPIGGDPPGASRRYHRRFWLREGPGFREIVAATDPRQDRRCQREGFEPLPFADLKARFPGAHRRLGGRNRECYYRITWTPDHAEPAP